MALVIFKSMTERNTIPIIKANGDEVQFDAGKLRNSLRKAGASNSLVRIILKKVEASLYPGISTAVIYDHAYDLLRESSDKHAGRYKLKQAILELGPSGFPFESFFSELLKALGYQTAINLHLQGKCIDHEVDVRGEKEGEMILAECKYHSQRGQKSDIKIALYVKARFQDIEEALQIQRAQPMPYFLPWLVTNTRFSDDAMQFGRCAGLNLMGWDYPHNYSIKYLVELHGLFPITCLSLLTSDEKDTLLNQKHVLCRDLVMHPSILDVLKIPNSRKSKIIEEAKRIVS